MQRNYEGRGTKSFPVISGCATFLIHQCIYQFRSSPNVLFRHFYNPVSRPFFLSKCWWVGMKVLTLESFVWYFWWPDPSWSYNIDRDIRKKISIYIPRRGHHQCGVCTLLQCLHGFSLASSVSFHISKTCMWGEFAYLSCASMTECVCWCEWALWWRASHPGLVPVCALRCQDRLRPPMTLNWNQ